MVQRSQTATLAPLRMGRWSTFRNRSQQITRVNLPGPPMIQLWIWNSCSACRPNWIIFGKVLLLLVRLSLSASFRPSQLDCQYFSHHKSSHWKSCKFAYQPGVHWNYGLLVFKYEGRWSFDESKDCFETKGSAFCIVLLCCLRPGPKAACGWLRAANGELHSTWRWAQRQPVNAPRRLNAGNKWHKAIQRKRMKKNNIL